MIVYDKFWETMKRCGESTYTLSNHYSISSGTIDRIRKGQGSTTAKLDDFCRHTVASVMQVEYERCSKLNNLDDCFVRPCADRRWACVFRRRCAAAFFAF